MDEDISPKTVAMRRYLDTVHYDFERDTLQLETTEGGVSSYLMVSGAERANVLQGFIWNWESILLKQTSSEP
jgi:hypothetical protein